MGDSAPSTKKASRDIFHALKSEAPGAIEAINKTLGGTALAQLGAEEAVAPGYQKLYRDQELANAATEAAVVGGPSGQSLVDSADKYQKQLDPEFYSNRAMLSEALGKYVGDYDPNQLSPTEIAQISRGINATTGPTTPSNLNTVRNAQVFGDAGTRRWQNFGQAITQAASVLPTLRSGIQGFETARTRGTDVGSRQATQGAVGSNFGFSTSALSDISGAANAAMAKKKDAWDKALSATQSLANVGQAAGGFAGMSDIRTKTDVKPFEPGLDVIEKLNPVSWVYNGEFGSPKGVAGIGVVAQDIEQIIPEAVFEKDGVKMVNYSPIIFALLNAVKELSTKVKILENAPYAISPLL